MTIRKELRARGAGRQPCAGGGWLRWSGSLAIGTIITDKYALAPTPGKFTSSVWLRPSQLFQMYSRVLTCTQFCLEGKVLRWNVTMRWLGKELWWWREVACC